MKGLGSIIGEELALSFNISVMDSHLNLLGLNFSYLQNGFSFSPSWKKKNIIGNIKLNNE